MGIRKKLTAIVCVAVSVAFAIAAAMSVVYFVKITTDGAVSDQSYEFRQMTMRVEELLNRAEEIAVAVAIDNDVQSVLLQQDTLGYPNNTSFNILKNQYLLSRLLKGYMYINPSLTSIFIVNDELQYSNDIQYSSYLVTQEAWYSNYQKSNESIYISRPHISFNASARCYEDVVSMAVPVYDIKTGAHRLGTIIVNISMKEINRRVTRASDIVEGIALYNKSLDVVTAYGRQGFSAEEIPANGQQGWHKHPGGVLVYSKSSRYGWAVAGEISNKLLFRKLAYLPFYFLCSFVVLLSTLILTIHVFVSRLLSPIEVLTKGVQAAGQGDFKLHIDVDTKDEFHDLAVSFNKMQGDLEQYLAQSIDYETTLKDMEIERLMLQINPHFIYNTLDSIVYMAQKEDNKDIVKFTKSFIALLHNTLTVSENSAFIELGHEIDNIRHYIVLKQYRYPDRFTANINISPVAARCMVPNIFVLTLVENAIFHGICPMESKGVLSITADVNTTEQVLTIVVEDNGVGIPPDIRKNLFSPPTVPQAGMRKIGISNIQQRISQIYGEPYQLQIQSEKGCGTRATIRIPVEYAEERENFNEVLLTKGSE